MPIRAEQNDATQSQPPSARFRRTAPFADWQRRPEIPVCARRAPMPEPTSSAGTRIHPARARACSQGVRVRSTCGVSRCPDGPSNSSSARLHQTPRAADMRADRRHRARLSRALRAAGCHGSPVVPVRRPASQAVYLCVAALGRISAIAAMRFVSGWRPREWCMAPSDRFITFSQLSIGLAAWRCGLFRLR